MSASTTLAPCPFCGGEATEKHRINHNAVTCTACGASVSQSEIGYGDAGKRWNRRAPAPASSEHVAVPAGGVEHDSTPRIVGTEPVAHLIVRSAFRASPHGQDAEGKEWLEEAHSPDEPGAFAVYTAAQVQAMLAAAPRNAPLYNPDSVSFSGSPDHREQDLVMVAPSGQALVPLSADDPTSSFMRLCPSCGNKRCPQANHHLNACTGSNEPGQPGSAYPAHGITAATKGGKHGAK